MDSSLKQSENILGLIDECLKQAKISVNELNAIACVIGPGSFTGIRIGAGLAKGICFAKQEIKRIPINSLDLVAYSFSKTNPNKEFWVCLNALSGNIFACKYSACGNKLVDYTLISGEALNQIGGLVVGILDENLEICNNKIELNSQDLLEYATNLYSTQKENLDFVPLYLRKSQAEAELDKKDANS